MRLYINQAGYLPGSIKTVILAEEADKQKKHEFMAEKVIRIYPQGDETCILKKKAEYFGLDEASGDDIWRVDFSELTQDGIYRIKDEEGNAVSVRVHEKIYDVMNQILCKALYYQRCGMELEEPYAGIFRRKSCHEDKADNGCYHPFPVAATGLAVVVKDVWRRGVVVIIIIFFLVAGTVGHRFACGDFF